MQIDKNEENSGGVNLMDRALRDKAVIQLKKMKLLEKENFHRMKYKRISNTTIIASTSEERLLEYEKSYKSLN